MSMKFVLLVAVSAVHISCSKKEVNKDISQSIEVNKSIKSQDLWENSEFNPKVIFSALRETSLSEQKALSNQVCKTFEQLKNEELDLYSAEIENPMNINILSDCHLELQQRLLSYWSEQRISLDINLDNLKSIKNQIKPFKTSIDQRDFSKGAKLIDGQIGRKQLILTFDDGPHGQYTPTILQVLNAFNAKAIFFALGKQVKGNPNILKSLAISGHAIGSHSVTHPCLGDSKTCNNHNKKHYGKILSRQEALNEIKGGHQNVFDVLGFVEPFFRFPFGEASGDLTRFLAENGVADFRWNIDSNDWRSQTPQQLVKNVVRDVQTQQRGILLFHDVQRKTVEALPQILNELSNLGYEIVLLQSSDPMVKYNSPLVRRNLPKP